MLQWGKGRTERAGFTLIELLVVIAIIAVVAAILFPVFSRVRENGRAAACLSNMRQLHGAILMYTGDNDDTYPPNRMPDAAHPLGVCKTQAMQMSGLEGSSLTWKRLIMPYVKNREVYRCPSNGYAWQPGDETNPSYPKTEALPISYAYNGSYFHEHAVCKEGENQLRPRKLAEMREPSRLIEILESRMDYSDLSPDSFGWSAPNGGTGLSGGKNASRGAFQTHNGMGNWCFADGHVKRVKLAATCSEGMWFDGHPDVNHSCANVSEIPQEYR